MKLTRFNPSALGSVSDFDQWLRHPFAGMPALGQFFGQLGELLPASVTGRLAADVHEDANNYVATFEVPGIKKEDTKVELHDRLLTVSVEKKEKNGEAEQSYTLTRSISVPEAVQADAISAKLEDGLLTVTLPKQEERKPRTITVG